MLDTFKLSLDETGKLQEVEQDEALKSISEAIDNISSPGKWQVDAGINIRKLFYRKLL